MTVFSRTKVDSFAISRHYALKYVLGIRFVPLGCLVVVAHEYWHYQIGEGKGRRRSDPNEILPYEWGRTNPHENYALWRRMSDMAPHLSFGQIILANRASNRD